jgi:poly-gamma-glutamate capsule biosynthesis protein CapA/YwtB (metallophosphatase superfamily)
MAVGDIMMGTDFPKDRLPPNDGKELFKDVKAILSSADLTIGNLEGVLLDGGEPRKQCRDTSICYLFRTPTKYGYNLVECGFDFISVANNHANDFGKAGIKSTKDILDKNGIQYSGRIGDTAVKEVNGIKIGFIAFATSSGCYSLLNYRYAAGEIKALKKKCDVLIVSFHGGAEGMEALHVADSLEIAYGEKRGNVIRFSKNAIDAGADLVIGHGPHVPRAVELYKNKLIAYSLGNFCTYKGFSLEKAKGLAPILNVKLDGNGNFVEGKIISAKQVRPYGPLLDPNQSVYKLIQKLTNEDIKENKLLFSPDGSFTKK